MKKIFLLLFAFPFLVNAQTTLPTSWNFSDPGIASPPNGWILGLGTNGNLTYSGSTNSVGGDGIACRLDATGEFAQIWFADKPGPVSYYVRGTGISPNPSFLGTFKIQESIDGNTWSDLHVFTDNMPGTMTRYEDNPASASRYIRFFYTDKQSGSNVALDSVWIQSAPAGSTASINIKQGATTLVNNNTFVIGTSSSTTFTIENRGVTEALDITSVNIIGEDASDYAVTGMPTSIAANSSSTFTITFSPGHTGSHFASISIENNDPDKNPFVINLYGIGGSYASEPVMQAKNLTFSNVKAYTFNGTFMNPSTKPESYIVLRKNTPVNEVPVDGHTYVRGDYIGGNQVVYVGSDTTFKPAFILANTDYYFAVFAFNGPTGFENYLTTTPLKALITTPGASINNYYSDINASSSTLIADLHNKINPHDTVFYSYYISTIINNFYTRDTSGAKKAVNCVYTNIPYVYNEPFTWWTGTGGNPATLTREHTYAQSWMPSNDGSPNWFQPGGKELPEYNDLHHLYPADQQNGNVKRSNYPFGEVVNATYTSPSGYGKLGTDINGKIVWEPRDEQKGDLARALFYMCTTYNGVNGRDWSLSNISVAQQDEAVLKKWHFQDLPDALEIARNEYVASVQHNRNPFIDSVNFACHINFNNMTAITDPGVCGATLSSMKITTPSGGEIWNAGETHTINWTSTNIDSVKIEYTINGSPYVSINESVYAADGSYSWVIPNTLSTNAVIKITQKNVTKPMSASSAIFTISNNTGIKEHNLPASIEIFPNPSNGVVSIKKAMNKVAVCNIFDVTGRMIDKIILANETTTIKIDDRGVFIFQINTADETTYKKVIVE